MMVFLPNQNDIQNVPIELIGKNILIYIEVVDNLLDYNILLGQIYMYAFKIVSSIIFHLVMFLMIKILLLSISSHIMILS